jgi:urease accessory protein
MRVADAYLGRRDDPEVAGRLDGDHLRIAVDDTDRRRSRFRTRTAGGDEIGVAVGRVLRDGDVLDADGTPGVVELEPAPALAVDLDALDPAAAVRFGHALGNRHRDLAVRAGRALVPAGSDGGASESALRDALPDGTPIDRTTVPPSVFDDAGGWGGGGGHEHDHGHDHERAGNHRGDHDHEPHGEDR